MGKPADPPKRIKYPEHAVLPEPANTGTEDQAINTTLGLENFHDFVPIENNANDFVLDIPLDEFDNPMEEDLNIAAPVPALPEAPR